MREATRTPPQCLYITDPHRLSVESIKIIAEATLTLTRSHQISSNHITAPAYHALLSSNVAVTPARRSRTRSLEIGARAKEALRDIRGLGRSAAQGLKDGIRYREGLGDVRGEEVNTSASTLAWPVKIPSSPAYINDSKDKIGSAARRVYILEPRGDVEESNRGHFSPVEVYTRSYLETRKSSSTWESRGDLPIEYIKDAESATRKARAGIFKDSSNEIVASESVKDSIEPHRPSGNALVPLCLKISSPALYFNQKAGNGTVSSSISFHFHLRITQQVATLPFQTRFLPAGPRTPRSDPHSPGQATKKKIVFVSTYSWNKLMNAIDSDYILTTPQSAKLEGIDWVAVDQEAKTSSGLIDFDWIWKDLSRGNAARVDTSTNIHDCAFAFIELQNSGPVRMLAASQYHIVEETPLSPMSHFISQHKPNVGLAIDYNGMEKVPLRPNTAKSDPFFIQESSEGNVLHGLSVTCVSCDLEGGEEDGPILRAAVQSLEKRILNLHKVAKVISKAAIEVREKLGELQSSQMAFEDAFKELSLMMPSTVGYLNETILQQAQAKESQRRQEEIILLRDHVEAPLLHVMDQCKIVHQQIKSFENESKGYYNGTQKWLASKAATSSSSRKRLSSGKAEADLYSPTAIGFDKSAMKQEKLDCEQRLRQLRFYLARLGIFRVMNTIHGGETELQVAQHVLALSRWRCNDDGAALKTIRSMQSALSTELGKISKRVTEIDAKRMEVEEQMTELSRSLAAGTSGFDAVGVSLSSLDAETGIKSAKRRETSLLSLGGQGVHISNDLSLRDDLMESVIKHDITTPHKRSSGSGTHRPHSMMPVLDSSRPTSSAQRHDAHLTTLAQYSHTQERSVSDPMTSSSSTTYINSTSKTYNRLQYGISSPRSPPMSSPDYYGSRGTTGTSDMHRRSSIGSPCRRISMPSSCTRVDEIMAPPPPPSRMFLLQPQRVAQYSRKKEGILWAMSRSISGPGGDETPRALSKSHNWKESWVVLSGSGHLGQYADWKNVNLMEPSQPLIDLRFATVRQARNLDRRFTFEIVTKDNRRFFQAANEIEMKEWIGAISLAIESLINGTSSIRQTEKVAKKARDQSPFLRPGDDFDPSISSSNQGWLGQHREFSQSLNDLRIMTSSGPSRLFQRGHGGKANANRKRDSKIGEGHLLTHSEGTPSRSNLWSSTHERGISNKTHLSGYLVRSESMQGNSSSYSQSDCDAEHEYDRRIEEMIHSSFGLTPQKSSSCISSETPSRSISSIQTKNEDPMTRDKYTRYKEICDIVQRPENRNCADCKAEDPKWASWALNGQLHCIFICITCSGIHRSLGVGVSKVKSVDLDDWTEEQIISARKGGNFIINKMYEATKAEDVSPVIGDGERNRSFFIRKYVDREWYQLEVIERSEKAKEDHADLFNDLNVNEETGRAMSSLLDEKYDGQWSSPKPKGANETTRRDKVEFEKDGNNPTTSTDATQSSHIDSSLFKATKRFSAHSITHCSPSRSIGVLS